MSFSLYTRTSKQTASLWGNLSHFIRRRTSDTSAFSVAREMAFIRHSRILPLIPVDPRMLPETTKSKCKKVYTEQGLTRLDGGRVAYLPFITRAIRKLENIIRNEMEEISADEISLPFLINESLFQATGRSKGTELFKLADRKGRTFVLAPTHEEAITDLVGENTLPESVFPLRFYQMSCKFRDEPKVKHGIVRCKEFIMNDLYCFDVNSEARDATYNEVVKQYHSFFKKLEIPYLCTFSCGRDMLSEKSQEFHFMCDFGEDKLLVCNNCGYHANMDLNEHQEKCSKCSSTNTEIKNGIEIAHAFNIGTIYSEKLNAYYHLSDRKKKLLEMSSYGIGISRLVGAALEILSNSDSLRWPKLIAPYLICLIPPKEGSKEEIAIQNKFNDLYNELGKCFKGEIVIDDRTKITVGKRLVLNKHLGFPFFIIIGKNILNETPKIEVVCIDEPEPYFVEPSDLVSLMSNLIKARLGT